MTEKVPDNQFASVALTLGLLTSAQIDEAYSIQAQMQEMGIQESLSQVLVKKGFLNAKQVNQILRTMGVQVQPIPGYQILGRLGQGGMGAVYKAKQKAMDRVVAIKVLNTQATQDKDFIGRFFREAQAAARLNHKNIIQAYDAGAAGNLYYFIMEYVEGTSVKRVVDDKGRIPEKEALQITLQIAEALEYIGKHGLVHRDIKPENVMVTKEGVAKLCDFGLARSTAASSLTRAGLTFGTPYYMSPEQIKGARDLDIRSDMYSLGATLFHMLTGHPPFEGKDLREVLSRHLTQSPPKASEVAPNVSERTSQVILKLLEKNRDHRYEDPKSLVEDLQAILRGMNPRHARSVTLRRKKGSRPVPALAAAAAVIALVVGTIAVVALMSAPEDDPSPTPPTAKEKTPPPEPAKGPDPSEPPEKTDENERPAVDPREMEAETLIAKADTAFEQGAWTRARRLYQEAEEKYVDTAAFLDRKKRIWERMKTAEDKEEALKVAAKRDEAQRRLIDRFNLANGLIGDRRWKAALEAFEWLAEQDLPPDISRAEIGERIQTCRRELKAREAWDEIVRLQQEKSWLKLEEARQVFLKDYEGTVTLKSHEVDLSTLETRLKKEVAASEALAAAREALNKEAWDDAEAKLDEAEENYGGTDIWKSAAEEIASMRDSIESGRVRPKEEAALAAWEAAEKAFEEKNWDAARSGYRKLTEGDLAATDFAKQKKSEIDARLQEVQHTLAEARDEEAKRLFKKARRLYDKKEFEEAHAIFTLLDSKYADTKYIGRFTRTLGRYLKTTERMLVLAEKQVVDDFEGEELEGWSKRDPAGFDKAEDAKVGSGALQVRLGEHKRNEDEGNWPRVQKDVEGEIPEETVAVTFWIRLPRESGRTKLWVTVQTGEGPTAAIYGTEVSVGAEWQQVRLYFRQFRLIWGGRDLVRNRLRPPLEIGKIRRLGFAHVNPFRGMRYVVDDIRLEYGTR